MAVSDGYKVRPSPQKAKRDVFKVLLSPANLLLLGMKDGDICNINSSTGLLGPIMACLAKEKIKDDIIQTSLDLQDLYGFKLNERVFITPRSEPCLQATEITLDPVAHDAASQPGLHLNETERHFWTRMIQLTLEQDAEKTGTFITPGLVFENVEVLGKRRSFQVQSVNASNRRELYHIEANSDVCIAIQSGREHEHRALSVPTDGVGGLQLQLQQVNERIGSYNGSPGYHSCPDAFRWPCKGGLIFHGAPGTGKSLVLRKISEAGWQKVFHINRSIISQASGETESALTRVVSNALDAQPSVIIIDNLHLFGAKAEDQDAGASTDMGELLCEQLDRLSGNRVLVVGAVRRLSDIDQRLQRAGRFTKAIEVPIPDSASRAEILKVLQDLPGKKAHPLLDSIATRTHGFVGADLGLLLNEAKNNYSIRSGRLEMWRGNYGPDDNTTEAIPEEVDFNIALAHVHPTAMRNIFIEPPNVRWTDIGGQHKVKNVLQQAVVWPFKYAELMEEYGASPSKGLLLYGPPGCSKTMVAKAAATESGLNFIAVRGPELIRMYVGESERALREVFSKARAVRPSIVFFDEIDAIGALGGTGQHGAVQTVTTLLNELDGFATTEGVFVLAATNKPEALDPALIRAGRLDTTLYVGLPDIEARHDILRIQMRSMPLGHDINEAALSEATEGFSGAEIVQVCKQARMTAIAAVIESQVKRPVSQEHFVSALAEVQKSVTVEMVKRYETWGAERH